MRRTRTRLLIAVGAGVVLLLVAVLSHFVRHGNAVWVYTPPEPGVAHFDASGGDLFVASSSGRAVDLDLATGVERPGSEFRRPFALLGQPLIVDRRVLLGGDDSRLRCLDLAGGRALWEIPTGGAVRGRPTVSEGRVYFGSDDGYVYCADLNTGTLLWQCYSGGPVGAEVALTDSHLVAGLASRGVVGMDASPAPSPPEASAEAPTAAVTAPAASVSDMSRWSWGLRLPAAVLSPVVSYEPGKIVVGSDEGAAYFLQAADGKFLFKVNFGGMVRCRPAAVRGYVVLADTNGDVRMVDDTGRPVWSRELRTNPTAGVVFSGAALYLSTAAGQVLALRLTDGATLWRRDLPAPGGDCLQVTDALVLVGLDDGRICAFRRPPRG
ncbi:MAG TPA: PQQ-binding-like beta-propeller repeat protein [Armatimonadota bacterium]|jgi:serine/threonine-protein kinase